MGLPRTIELTGWCLFGQQEVCGLTPDDAQGEIRRINDFLDADPRNQFDWAGTATEQGRFDRKTKISSWFVVSVRGSL